MILTCPKCATRFFVSDDAIGKSARSVQCSACHQVWLTEGLEPTNADILPEPEGASTPSEKETAISETTASPLFVERSTSARKAPSKPLAQALTITLLILVVIGAGVLVFQKDVERAFPGTAAIYRALGVRNSDRAASRM